MIFKEIIGRILEEEPRARKDDKWLTFKVYQEIAKQNGKDIFIPFELFNKFPSPETIIRTRAKLQNEEKRYLPKGEEAPLKKEGETIIVENDPKFKNSWMIPSK